MGRVGSVRLKGAALRKVTGFLGTSYVLMKDKNEEGEEEEKEVVERGECHIFGHKSSLRQMVSGTRAGAATLATPRWRRRGSSSSSRRGALCGAV